MNFGIGLKDKSALQGDAFSRQSPIETTIKMLSASNVETIN